MDEKTIEIIKYYDDFSDRWNLEPIHREYIFDEIWNADVRLQLDIYEYDKKAPTLIFIPGTATYSMLFSQLLHLIYKAGYNVIGFDPRGHGRSQGERGDYTFEEIVSDTHCVVEYALKKYNENVALLGCSQGGIAAFYAASADARIKTVICQPFADLGSKDVFQLTPYPRLFSALSALGQPIVERFPNYKVPITSYLPLDKERVPYFGNAKLFTEKDPFAITHVRLKTMQSLSYTKLPKPLSEFRTPICVLQAGSDRVFPLTYVKQLYDQLHCEKELVIFNGLHHIMFVEAPQRIAPSIIQWLDLRFPK